MKKLLFSLLCISSIALASDSSDPIMFSDDQHDQPLAVESDNDSIATGSLAVEPNESIIAVSSPDHVSPTPTPPLTPVEQVEDSSDASNQSGVEFGRKYSDKEEDTRHAVLQGPRDCYRLDMRHLGDYLNNIKGAFATALKVTTQLATHAHTEPQRTASNGLIAALHKMFSNSEASRHLGNLSDYSTHDIGYLPETDLTRAAQHSRSLTWKIARVLCGVNAFDESKLSSLLEQCNIQEAAFRLYPNPASASSSAASSTGQTSEQEIAERIALEASLEKIRQARAKLESQSRNNIRIQRKLTAQQLTHVEQREKDKKRIKRRLKPDVSEKQPRLTSFFKSPPKR